MRGPRSVPGPVVRSFPALDGLAARLRRRAIERGHRAVLLLRPAGPADLGGVERWVRRRLRDGADVPGRPRDGATPDVAHRVQRLLGGESDGVRVALAPARVGGCDDRRGASPALLAAALGTVRAGGLVVLVAPRGPARRSALARRLVERLERSAAAPDGLVTAVRLAPGFGRRERCAPSGPAGPPARRAPRVPLPAPVPSSAALAEQERLLARARVVLARPRGTVVLLGARGRGKSALAGRLHRLATDRPSGAAPLVTSAARGAVTSLERHAGAAVRFVPPDVALREPAATLFVDEAATLPTALLGALLARHGRAVLATTVSGHETAGRAFAQRLARLLGPERAGAAVLEPERAMRWREGDPLERALDRALLLDAMATRPSDASAGPSAAGRPRTAARVRRVPPARWRADEGALRALVRLLAATHYQSALDDVEHVLGGALDAYVATDADGLVGAALVAREGGLDPGLGPDVLAGRRRLPDQLLPQLLARAAGDPSALDARYARVVRIAVAPRARRAGVGSALLRTVAAPATPALHAVDAIGASFAAEDGATAFWLANGYRCFHEGTRINPRSGTTSRSMLLVPGLPDAAGDAPRDVARRLVAGVRANAARRARRAVAPPRSGPERGTNVHEPRRPAKRRAARC